MTFDAYVCTHAETVGRYLAIMKWNAFVSNSVRTITLLVRDTRQFAPSGTVVSLTVSCAACSQPAVLIIPSRPCVGEEPLCQWQAEEQIRN